MTTQRGFAKLIIGNRVVEPTEITWERTWDEGPVAKVVFPMVVEDSPIYAPDAQVELLVGYEDESGVEQNSEKSNWRIAQTEFSSRGDVTLTLLSMPNVKPLPF